jgi:hypothetical protein
VPSVSGERFASTINRAKVLLLAASRETANADGLRRRQVIYHAALAAYVASWDAYVRQITLEFFDATANPLDPPYHMIHSTARALAENALKRFNTPNWDNSRELLIAHTGFDPYSTWVWPSQRYGVQQTKERLNQILRVRHSFAHGFVLPSLPWTQNSSGQTRLTREELSFTERFFRILVRETDKNMKSYIESNFPVSTNW